jgi:hypothetical protein
MKPLALICALVLSSAVAYAQGTNIPDTASAKPREAQFHDGSNFGGGQSGPADKSLTKDEALTKISRALARTDEMLARLAQTKQELLAKQARISSAPADAQFGLADIMPERRGQENMRGPRDMMKPGASQGRDASGSEPPPPPAQQ